MKKIILTVLLLITCAGCPKDPVSPHPTPEITDTEMCIDASNHLIQMCNENSSINMYCCTVVSPTKKGKSFIQFCTEKQNQGIFLNPRCLASITSCDQIDHCTLSE